MRRTSSSPPQRTSSSQSKHGASSSQPLAKKQKTDHNPPIDLEHKRLLEQQKDRIRQDSLKSTIRREYAESICYPPKRYVPTNPTADEKVEQENQEFIAEQKRIKRLEERYPGVSIETLLRVFPKPTKNSEYDAREQRIKEKILKEHAKGRNIKDPDSINKFIVANLGNVSQELVNHVELYGIDGAHKNGMKNGSRHMTHERVPSNRGGAGRGGRRY